MRRLRPFTLVAPLAAFGILFPIIFFRFSRSLWLGIASYIEASTTEKGPTSSAQG